MLPPMFGMGGSEIILILVVALLFLGPDKLPQAAKQISKGIRDLKKQTRSLQNQIEGDEQIGGALRDIKSALRGEDAPVTPKKIKPKKPKALPEGEASINPPPDAPGLEASAAAAGIAAAPVSDIEASADAAGIAASPLDAEPAPDAPPAVRLPPEAGERDHDAPPPAEDDDEALASLIKPAAGTVAKGSEPTHG